MKISVQEEMSALEKQLEASQRFLGGVRSLASYEDIQQKQLRGLLIALGKSKDLSTSQAASFVEAIDSRLWSVAAVEELQRQVAAKTSQGEVDSERRRMQDFSQIIHFLTPDLATMNWKETPPPTLSCEACACTLAGCHYVCHRNRLLQPL